MIADALPTHRIPAPGGFLPCCRCTGESGGRSIRNKKRTASAGKAPERPAFRSLSSVRYDAAATAMQFGLRPAHDRFQCVKRRRINPAIDSSPDPTSTSDCGSGILVVVLQSPDSTQVLLAGAADQLMILRVYNEAAALVGADSNAVTAGAGVFFTALAAAVVWALESPTSIIGVAWPIPPRIRSASSIPAALRRQDRNASLFNAPEISLICVSPGVDGATGSRRACVVFWAGVVRFDPARLANQ